MKLRLRLPGAIAVQPRLYPDLTNRIELVIAREDHVFFADLLAADFRLDHLQVNEPGQKVEQAVPLPHLLPQVGRLVLALGCWWVPGAHPVSLVQRQKEGALPGELRCHEDQVGINSEVNQSPGEVGRRRLDG